MESVDWVERYFWFGAMYEMASHSLLPFLPCRCFSTSVLLVILRASHVESKGGS